MARTLFTVVGTAWAVLTGVAGSIMAGLWALTDHAVAAGNENVLQCTVIALALGLVLPFAVRNRARWASTARACAIMVGGASLLGLLLKLLPAMDQSNLQVLALTVPANLGLAAGVLSWTAAPRD